MKLTSEIQCVHYTPNTFYFKRCTQYILGKIQEKPWNFKTFHFFPKNVHAHLVDFGNIMSRYKFSTIPNITSFSRKSLLEKLHSVNFKTSKYTNFIKISRKYKDTSCTLRFFWTAGQCFGSVCEQIFRLKLDTSTIKFKFDF